MSARRVVVLAVMILCLGTLSLARDGENRSSAAGDNTPGKFELKRAANGQFFFNLKAANGQGRLADICRQWEKAFYSVAAAETRRILFRIGIVLGRDGGALPLLAHYTRWFLGGAAGNGRQYISWVHLADLVRMFRLALQYDNFFDGTYNAVAPNPATNAEFMRTLRHALYRPWCPPAPAWAIRLGCKLTGTEASLALDGCRCAPKRFLESGFEFKFTELRAALKEIHP